MTDALDAAEPARLQRAGDRHPPPTQSLFDPAIVSAAAGRQRPQARPPRHGPQPGDVRGRGRLVLTTLLFLRDLGASTGDENVFAGLVAAVAVVHRAVRQLRRGDGRGPGQGPGRHAAQDPRRDRRPPAPARRQRSRRCPVVAARRRRRRASSSAGEVIPGDGDVVEGIASVDESAITGESAPVIRESGGDRSAVTGGTRVLSDEIVVRITAQPGETFLDRMIALVEGAERQKTPNEIALNILLAGLTIIFLLAVVTLQPFAIYSGAEQDDHRAGRPARLPHPHHHRRAAVGHRHRRHGPPGAAQRAGHVGPGGRGGRRLLHAAARQDRHDHPRQPPGRRVHPRRRRRPSGSWPTRRSCPAWPTRRPRAARSSRWPRSATACATATLAGADAGAVHRPDPHERHRPRRPTSIRKGAADSVRRWVAEHGRRGARRARHRRRRHRRRPAARRWPWPAPTGRRGQVPRRDPAQGHRQAGHERALRPAAGHGHPHGDDHRRQPAHRRSHRRRGRRRRLPGRGHARGQDGADPQGAGRRAPRGHDRRRHQRRPGPGPGRRRAWP